MGMERHRNSFAPIKAQISSSTGPSGKGIRTQYLITVSEEIQSPTTTLAVAFPGSQWTVYKRFSEHRQLKLLLTEEIRSLSMESKLPICDVCMSMLANFRYFPRRHLFRSNDPNVIASRTTKLNYFLQSVIETAKFCHCEAKQVLRKHMDEFLLMKNLRYTFLNLNIEDPTSSFSQLQQEKLAIETERNSEPVINADDKMDNITSKPCLFSHRNSDSNIETNYNSIGRKNTGRDNKKLSILTFSLTPNYTSSKRVINYRKPSRLSHLDTVTYSHRRKHISARKKLKRSQDRIDEQETCNTVVCKLPKKKKLVPMQSIPE